MYIAPELSPFSRNPWSRYMGLLSGSIGFGVRRKSPSPDLRRYTTYPARSLAWEGDQLSSTIREGASTCHSRPAIPAGGSVSIGMIVEAPLRGLSLPAPSTAETE